MSDTYIIGGKGYFDVHENGAPIETFTVPDECKIIVTIIDEDDIISVNDSNALLEKYKEYYGKLFIKQEETLKNPVESELDNLGITNIYASGSECPLLHHTLLLYDDGQIIPTMNGIKQTSALYDIGLPDIDLSIHSLTQDECLSIDYITRLYDNTYIPNNVEGGISSALTLLLKDDSAILLKAWEFDDTICKTMKDICEFTKGVFYCFVIRKSSPKAYWVGGHGSEDPNKTFIVPKGCTIVVNGISGDITDARITSKYYKNLIELPFNTLQYPKINEITIKQIVKNLVIYTEGMSCPSFNYETLGCYSGIGNCENVSGILDLSLLKRNVPDITLGYFSYKLANTNTFLNKMASTYLYSIYLRPSEFKLYYQRMMYPNNTNKHAFHENVKIGDAIWYNKHIKISQEKLCKMYPGVYYNFVCRYMGINSLKHRGTPKNSLRAKSSSNNSINKVLRRRVEEAVTQRAKLERNTYNIQKIQTEFEPNYNALYGNFVHTWTQLKQWVNLLNLINIPPKYLFYTNKATIDKLMKYNISGKDYDIIEEIQQFYSAINENIKELTRLDKERKTQRYNQPLKNVTNNYNKTITPNGKVQWTQKQGGARNSLRANSSLNNNVNKELRQKVEEAVTHRAKLEHNKYNVEKIRSVFEVNYNKEYDKVAVSLTQLKQWINLLNLIKIPPKHSFYTNKAIIDKLMKYNISGKDYDIIEEIQQFYSAINENIKELTRLDKERKTQRYIQPLKNVTNNYNKIITPNGKVQWTQKNGKIQRYPIQTETNENSRIRGKVMKTKTDLISKLKATLKEDRIKYKKFKTFIDNRQLDNTQNNTLSNIRYKEQLEQKMINLTDKIKHTEQMINKYIQDTKNIAKNFDTLSPYPAKLWTQTFKNNGKVSYKTKSDYNNGFNTFKSLMEDSSLTALHKIDLLSSKHNNELTNEEHGYLAAYKEYMEQFKQASEDESMVNSAKKGGALPLRYFDPSVQEFSSDAGHNVLGVSGLEVRPKIGGTRRNKRSNKSHTKRNRRHKGGFIPSIMEPLVLGVSKYIAPLAMFSGYKLINSEK